MEMSHFSYTKSGVAAIEDEKQKTLDESKQESRDYNFNWWLIEAVVFQGHKN